MRFGFGSDDFPFLKFGDFLGSSRFFFRCECKSPVIPTVTMFFTSFVRNRI